MAGSILVSVRKAIVAGLTAAINDPQVLVSYAYLGGDERRQREHLFMGQARATHDPAALKQGRNFRDESMDIDLIYHGLSKTGSPEELDDLMMTRAALIEEWFADRKSNELGIPGLNWLLLTSFEHQPFAAASGSGSAAEMKWTIHYRARLT